MATYQRPGIFVEEVPSSSKPIAGVATAILGIVGKFKKGPADSQGTLITSWGDFETQFGGLYRQGTEDYLAPHAVYQWYSNGGGNMYVGRVNGTTSEAIASVSLDDNESTPDKALAISAKNFGAWGNSLTVDIVRNSLSSTTLSGATTAGDTTIALTSVEGLVKGMVLKLVPTTGVTYYAAIESVNVTGKSVSLTTTLGAGTWAAGDAVTSEDFNIVVYKDSVIVEEWEHLSIGGDTGGAGEDKDSNKDGPRFVGTVIGENSNYITVSAPVGGYSTTDWNGTVGEDPRPANTAAPTKISGGHDGVLPSALSAADFGAEYLPYLDGNDDVTIVIAPDAYVQSTDAATITINNAITSYCENRQDCFGVLGLRAGRTVTNAAGDAGTHDGISYSALYYPWCQTPDPLTGGNIDVPPVGMVAGVYARTDATRGVHKAPAGQEAVTKGVIKLEYGVSNALNTVLLPAKVNPIRFFEGAGNVIWGSRTLATDASWRYVPVRRLMIYIEESILKGIRWSVFEPNDSALWAKLRLNISSFLMNTWRTGALAGAKPSEAFYVNCDENTNPQSLIDGGQVNVEIGVAPVKPAEFVIVKIGLWDGGKLMSEIG